mgnify:CR=1 FL=1
MILMAGVWVAVVDWSVQLAPAAVAPEPAVLTIMKAVAGIEVMVEPERMVALTEVVEQAGMT